MARATDNGAALPIEALHDDFLAALARGPVVATAPTGSGKSTEIPRWCAAAGPVVVVEPRRVAARALAQRVAELEGVPVGDAIGYAVRDERRAGAAPSILFVTTGVALRMLRSGDLRRFATVLLDEIHERSLDLDLLLALLSRDREAGGYRLAALSATVEADRIAEHLGGTHLRGEGRLFPVDVVHPDGQPPLPDPGDLAARVRSALSAAPPGGDVLVFLPGKAEIEAVAAALSGWPDEVLSLHGGLSLDAQSRIFRRGPRRRIVLATNVAETSLTVPGIAVVVDSGLVRRTRYHQGRGVLTLVPVARDAAEQRAGRAGRTGPGTVVRLWQERAPLAATTPPEIHRESLVPLVLAAAACAARGSDPLDLPWLDPPRPHAVEAAREALSALGALDGDGRLSAVGAELFGLPLDPALGRLVVEARDRVPGALHDAVDLVAALSERRSLFVGPPSGDDDDPRGPTPWPGGGAPARAGLAPEGSGGCDATALVWAVREGHPGRHRLDRSALEAVRATAKRLGRAMGLQGPPPPFDRRRLADLILSAWPGAAHVARRRKRTVAFANGGTEIELSRTSVVAADEADAIVVLEVRAVARHRLEQQLRCSAAMPVPERWLLDAGLGRDRLAGARVEGGRAVAVTERVYAGRVLDVRTVVPEGALAVATLAELFLRGSILDVRAARDRHEAWALHASLRRETGPPPFDQWVVQRLEALGVESGADLALLSDEDLRPDALDDDDLARLDRDYPRTLDLPDASYALRYHPGRRLLELRKRSGPRRELPPLQFVPSVPGWRIEVVDRNVRRVLRG